VALFFAAHRVFNVTTLYQEQLKPHAPRTMTTDAAMDLTDCPTDFLFIAPQQADTHVGFGFPEDACIAVIPSRLPIQLRK
jgi:hypothetical protein